MVKSAMAFEEFDRRYAGKRYEYVDGRPLPRGVEVVLPNGEVDIAPHSPLHLTILARVIMLVGRHILDHRLGVPLASGTGFFMTQDPPELRSADFAYLSPAQAAKCQLGSWLPFPPDFAVEIELPSDAVGYGARKTAGYMANGTRLLWNIDPEALVVQVHQPETKPRRLTPGMTLDGDPCFPGLLVPVAALFSF